MPRPLDLDAVKLAAKTNTTKQYAKIIHMSLSWVRYIAIKYKIKFKGSIPERDDVMIRKHVVDCYKRGMTRKAAREEVCVDYSVIQRHWPVAYRRPVKKPPETDPTNPENWPDYSTENLVFKEKPKVVFQANWRGCEK